MKIVILITVLLAALSCHRATTTPTFDANDEVTTVQDDVRAINGAVSTGDTDTLIRYTFPAIVEKLGGAEAFGKVYQGIAAGQARAGIKMESVTFPTPPEFIEGKNGRRFVLVPNRIVIVRKEGRGAVTGFQLGVKEPGATEWKYISGQFVRPDLLPALLPDFPAQHPLPPRSQEKLLPQDS